MRTPSFYERSWQELSATPSARQLWQHLDDLSKLPLSLRVQAFRALPRQTREGPALFVQARHLYLGWIYDGCRGRKWAGLPEPAFVSSGPASAAPRLASSPLRVDNGVITVREPPDQLDYLIVGSGPAGAVLGHQLRRAGFRVAVVERGPFVLPGRLNTREAPRLKVGGGAVPTDDFGIIVRTADAVGGGSTVNVDLAFAPTLPMVSQRVEQWRANGSIGTEQWTPVQVERAYAWVKQAIGTRQPSLEEVNHNNAILWEGGTATGLVPALYGLNTWPGRPPLTDKRSAVGQLLLEAMTSGQNPLLVLPDLEARRILVEEGQAVGVEARAVAPWNHPAVWVDPHNLKLRPGHLYTLRARRVILCAGAQGSAALLLRSGLGGPAVGQGLILHPSLPVLGRFPRRIDATVGTPSTVYATDPEDPGGVLYECMAAGPSYVALLLFEDAERIASLIRDFRSLGGFGVLLVDTVDERNRLFLDASGEPRLRYTLSEHDRRRFARAVGKAVRAMLAAGAVEVYLPSTEPYSLGAVDSAFHSAEQTRDLEERLHFRPGMTMVTAAHMQSTCKMGANPATSVVDYQHQVHGMPNLYVCDSSIFPTSVGANPMQMVYTLAKLFSDSLLTQDPGPGLQPLAEQQLR